jgi:hypothetical protein
MGMPVPSNTMVAEHPASRHVAGMEAHQHALNPHAIGHSGGILMAQGAGPPFDNRVPQMGMAPPSDMVTAGDSPTLFEPHRNQPMSSAAMEAQYFSALNSCGGAMMPPAHHTSQTFHAPATKGTGFNQDCPIPADSFTPPGMALHAVGPAV